MLVNNSGSLTTEDTFRALNPLVSFPAILTQADVEPYGMNVIVPSPPPAGSPFYQITEGAPEQVNGVWTQTWTKTSIALASAQQQQSQTLNAACAATIVGGFTSSALGSVHTYPSSLTDQQNLTASVTDAQLAQAVTAGWVASAAVVQTALGVPCSIITVNGTPYMCTQSGTCGATAPAWTTQPGTPIADGTAVWQVWTTEFWCATSNNGVLQWAWQPHTVEQIQLVGRVGKATVMAYQAKNADLQAQIVAATTTTVDQVAAIVWSA